MADPDSRTAFLLGAGYLASILVMFAGLVLAFMAGLNQDYLAAGMCLLAVGSTAGLALNAYSAADGVEHPVTNVRPWIRLIVSAAIVAMMATATPGAWGPQGHRLVAIVAEGRLTPVAKQNVAWLIDGRSLADLSIWADDYISGNSQTSLWHYVNIPANATAYDRERDCPRQPGVAAGTPNDRWRDCIVDRIPYHQERLANLSLDRVDRAIALKFLVHFVGDLHQPFHAIDVARGGNGILVTVFGSPTCGGSPTAPTPCNLHSVWDSSLIAHRKLNDVDYLALLDRVITSGGLAARPSGTPPDWAMESLRLARAALLPQQGVVDEAYYRAQIPVIDERLALAGLRLAALLNGALGR